MDRQGREGLEKIRQIQEAFENQMAKLVELGLAKPEDFDEVYRILEEGNEAPEQASEELLRSEANGTSSGRDST